MEQRAKIERHADILDLAGDLERVIVEDGLAHTRRKQEKQAKPTGFCAFCDARCEVPTARFCSPECSHDWHREQAANARNGRSED